MYEEHQGRSLDLITLTGEIVSAYVSNNPVPVADLAGLIARVHDSLQGISQGEPTTAAPAEAVEQPTPAQIRKSVTHDGIVSFIDGRSYKTLKRHLRGHGLDPYSYRKRYGLPADYPMTAPSYSEARSALAKNFGLGRPGRESA